MKYYAMLGDKGHHATLLTSFEIASDVLDNVVYPKLSSGGSRLIGIIGDRDRVNRHFEEFGPSRLAGQTYHLAKRKVNGAFHPKIILQIGKNGGRLVVASSNLTSGGIAGNLEVATQMTVHQEETWAAPLLKASLAYFSAHTAADDLAMWRIIKRAQQRGASWLQQAEAAREVIDPDGNRHALLVETESTGVADQFVDFTQADSIEKLVIVSPFWDQTLAAVSRLRESLGTPELSLVLDPRYHDLDPGAFSQLSHAGLHSIEELDARHGRRLHAKMIVACGLNADYVLSGSANATTAGLYGRRGGPGNAEACLARTEPAGTALHRLGLSVCLSETISIDTLAPPIPAPETETEADAPVRDGGALTLQHSRLIWVPPDDCVPATCRIILEGKGGTALETLTPRRIGNTWGADITCADAPPLRGRIHLSETETSAIVPLTSLDRLAQNSLDPVSRDYQKLLEAFRDQGELGAEMLDLAIQIRARHDAHFESQRRTVRSGRGGDNGDETQDTDENPPGNPLTEDEFYKIETEIKALKDEDARFGPLGETYRFINRVLGLGLDVQGLEDPDDLADLDSTNDDEVLEEDDYEGDPDGGNNGADPPPDPPPQSRRPRTARRRLNSPGKIHKNLKKQIFRLREDLTEKSIDPMDPGPAMLLRLAILAIIADGAPVGYSATPDHPVPAEPGKSGPGWIRLLGLLLRDMDHAWAADRFRDEPPMPEQLDCMGAMVFGATIAHEGAAATGMKSGISDDHEKLCARITRRIVDVVKDHPAAAKRLEEAMASYGAAHARSEARYQKIGEEKAIGGQ
ncbi:hypothetical protein N5A93_08255 [Roseovarius sp. EGI FJ00037]|uniref:hypothetical protein n=1 Tax=Roseovarius salincola TaxID=2978479 RepID=UPI0022A815E5|nr:hypothetical protein [Roseovarius sp. EGI FJ00037]MCZ0812220.1 hypothetical protein [Roseovarius sp. EGI FJ00037]